MYFSRTGNAISIGSPPEVKIFERMGSTRTLKNPYLLTTP